MSGQYDSMFMVTGDVSMVNEGSEDSIFDQALIEAGDQDWVMSASDFLDGWRTYREEYGENPDQCRLTKTTLMDMYADSVLRDMLVTEEMILRTPSVAPEKNLELFHERVSDDAFGLIMGMEIVIDDEFDDNEALLYQHEYGLTERSVVIRG